MIANSSLFQKMNIDTTPKKNLSALIRASVHYYNTEEEIDLLCKAILI